MFRLTALFFLVCFSFAFSCAAQIESVTIASKWSGLGKKEERVLVITENEGRYYASAREISGDRIAKLEQVLGAPEIPTLNLENLGVTQAWLNKNAVPAFPECCTYNGIWASAKQKQLFMKDFRDAKLMEKVIGTYIEGGSTDDYPQLEAVIKYSDKTIKLSSNGQAAYMLPWEIERGDDKIVTYNAGISRALINLLPTNFPNRERLKGTRFRPEISVRVMDEVFKELEKEPKLITKNLKYRQDQTIKRK